MRKLMIVKERDASGARIAFLEQLEATVNDTNQRLSIRHATARLRADPTTRHACQTLNSLFSVADDWMLLHDLRFNDCQTIFHTNHLLINAAMEFFVIDTRYIECGLSISDSGVWNISDGYVNRVISSPLNKLAKDIRFLSAILRKSDMLPKHFGITRSASVKGFVLTNPSIRTRKPRQSQLNTSAVVSADGLFRLIWKETDHWLNKHIKPENSENLQKLANKIAEAHKPAIAPQLLEGYAGQVNSDSANKSDTAHCASCGTGVSEMIREQCFRNMDSFEGNILCTTCQASLSEQRHVYASY